MTGRPGGGGISGGGAVGQKPYAPGENDRLPWGDVSLEKAIKQEEGTVRPILVLYCNGTMAKDCCAANFERVIFRDESVVEFAKKFKCVRTAELSEELQKRFSIEKEKPAILLFDAEGGLLHKEQRCQNPRTFFRALTASFKLNDTRMKLKEKFLAMRREARNHIGDENYARALRVVESMMKRRDKIAGSVLVKVEADQAEIEQIGQGLFDRATALRADNKLIEAYDLYKEVERQFARLDKLGREAERCASQVKAELKDLGISVR